jgi:hypothetical protein
MESQASMNRGPRGPRRGSFYCILVVLLAKLDAQVQSPPTQPNFFMRMWQIVHNGYLVLSRNGVMLGEFGE